MEQYEKKGYLNSEFRLFHLTDQDTKEIDYHYHDFDKITIFIRGKVNYMIEGRSYDLKPYDIVLVKQGDIHKLTVDNSCPYERIIVYISPNFMNAYQTENYDLSYCFQKADQEHSNVLRIPSPEKSSLFRSISNLEHSFTDGGYASELYRQVMFLEFMIHLNRAARKNRLEYIDTDNCNEKVLAILDYVANISARTYRSTDRQTFLYQQILYDEIIQAGNRLYTGTIYLPEAAPACKRTIIFRCAWHTGLLRLWI